MREEVKIYIYIPIRRPGNENEEKGEDNEPYNQQIHIQRQVDLIVLQRLIWYENEDEKAYIWEMI